MAVLRYAEQERRNIAASEERARQQSALNASIALRKMAQASDVTYQPLSSVLTDTTASFTTALKTKLDGIASGATANSADAVLLDRPNHTGEQAISTVTGLQSALDGKLVWATAPTAATDAGVTGQIAYDADYLYVCISSGNWKRAALSTW